jgi:hypothetical protein
MSRYKSSRGSGRFGTENSLARALKRRATLLVRYECAMRQGELEKDLLGQPGVKSKCKPGGHAEFVCKQKGPAQDCWPCSCPGRNPPRRSNLKVVRAARSSKLNRLKKNEIQRADGQPGRWQARQMKHIELWLAARRATKALTAVPKKNE